ncbi:tetratricopeptide repeat-containing sensor histidine kinase [Flagellimonas lutaonensis]|uniref:Putative signal transduction histidine kinase n=1 Tax=Flagellimonas lutaonensis TaxID=516051 RepID=A0A0D5YTD1_9FLAO|nr:tetratricopeptide repeat protein [Allomuricauda lutaonensis]AKA35572.1 Putative signal transduction histidine kinase [Allomuricauda lutaonensis]
MHKKGYILWVFLLFTYPLLSQDLPGEKTFLLEGSVKGKENYTPIAGVEVRTDKGQYTTTNGLGEFKIKVAIGDWLIVESPDFETVRHRIGSNEEISVLVEDYEPSRKQLRQETHQVFLDSAIFYKKLDIEKSIDFVVQAISSLGKRGNKKELANAYTVLGEIYQYHKQYDLAIDNFKYALEQRRTVKTSLLLGKTYILNKQFKDAENIYESLTDINRMVPYQRVEMFEGLGDANKGLGQIDRALDFYNEALKIAEKNQIAPKVTDLNSKIAETYAKEKRPVEAEGYFSNSLRLSKQEAPQRAIQENEKVADFYSEEKRFDDEIQLRKKSLKELKQLPAEKVSSGLLDVQKDSITPQRINYKIANAYIAQEKLTEAIPYLERSIAEADSEDDLVVQKDATRKLSEVYRYQGDFNKALETYQEYVSLVDTLYARKEQEISRAVRLNREIAAKQNQIASLEQDRELTQSKYNLALAEQQLSEESNKRQKWVIYSLIFGLLLMASTAFFYYRSNRQQKLANNLLALKSLRSQMNPHFIFNALNSVNNFIAKSDERSANRFLSEFSVLMRAVLENSEEDFIPLAKELELLELYVKLEHSRFPDKFDYSIEIDENVDVGAFEIPPMLLQPYIENAIWHGLRYKDEKGFLKIGVRQLNADLLQISISDNGIGRKQSAALKTSNQKKQKSKGMGNIKKRIAILNDMHKNKVDVSIEDLYDDATGTQVILKLRKD